MSFYSELLLVANDVARTPSEPDVRQMLRDLSLIELTCNSQFGNLADDITNLFNDTVAQRANAQFFCPDSIAFPANIDLQASGGDEQSSYQGFGWSISIHGNGYFYPWTWDDFRTRVLNSPKLRLLRGEVNKRYGGRFNIPESHAKLLNSRIIVNDGGWAWIGSESF